MPHNIGLHATDIIIIISASYSIHAQLNGDQR